MSDDLLHRTLSISQKVILPNSIIVVGNSKLPLYSSVFSLQSPLGIGNTFHLLPSNQTMATDPAEHENVTPKKI